MAGIVTDTVLNASCITYMEAIYSMFINLTRDNFLAAYNTIPESYHYLII